MTSKTPDNKVTKLIINESTKFPMKTQVPLQLDTINYEPDVSKKVTIIKDPFEKTAKRITITTIPPQSNVGSSTDQTEDMLIQDKAREREQQDREIQKEVDSKIQST